MVATSANATRARAEGAEPPTEAWQRRQRLTTGDAALSAWGVAWLVSAVELAFQGQSGGVLVLLQLLNTVEHLSLAAACWGVIVLWTRHGPKGELPATLVLLAVCQALGWYVLVDDFRNFSERKADLLPPVATLSISVALVASAPSGVWLIGSRLTRRRSWLVAVCALLVLVINKLVLIGDYRAVHLYLTLTAISALTGTLANQPTLGWLQRWPNPRFGAVALLAGGGALVALSILGPPNSASGSWLHSGSAQIYRVTARLLGGLRGSSAALAQSGEWFQPRPEGLVTQAMPPPIVASPIVFLITVDALRADVIDGRHDKLLKNFGQLRKEGVWFTNARAPGALTKISVTSVFMGKYFSQQYWAMTKGGIYGVGRDITRRFPELLVAGDVHTINYRAINWLRNGVAHVRGFAEEHKIPRKDRRQQYRPARPVIDLMVKRLKTIDKTPVFIHTHLSDPHAPYNLGSSKGSEYDRYLSEVKLVDSGLGRLIQAVNKHGLASRSIFIIQADHGEAFGEHGSKTHGTTLYDEALHVPLLIRLPDKVHRRVDALVTTMDLGPTILQLFGKGVPGYFMGQSLVPYLLGQQPELTRPVLAENRLQQALWLPNGLKVIYDTRQNTTELYNLKTDPRELKDISDDKALLGPALDTLKTFFHVHSYRDHDYSPPFIR